MEGAAVVLHLAALLHLPDPAASLREVYERTNVGGTRTVVEAACRAAVGTARVLQHRRGVWGRAVRRGHGGERVSPRFVLRADQAGRREDRARGEAGRWCPLGTVLRLGAVYGSRIKGNYERLVRALARGRFIPIGAGGTRRSMIYDRDAAAAAVLAMGHPAAAGRVFNVTDGQFHELRDIIGAICAALGRKPPRWSVPVAPVRAAAAIVEGCFKGIGQRPPITRATIDKYTEDFCVDGSLIQRDLGFRPAYDLQAGWREAIDLMRQAGQV